MPGNEPMLVIYDTIIMYTIIHDTIIMKVHSLSSLGEGRVAQVASASCHSNRPKGSSVGHKPPSNSKRQPELGKTNSPRNEA